MELLLKDIWAIEMPGEYLPPGSYEILFTTKDCTEENAKLVAESMSPYITGMIFKDYETGYFEFDAACPSLKSLLRSKNLDPAKNYLLIKKL